MKVVAMTTDSTTVDTQSGSVLKNVSQEQVVMAVAGLLIVVFAIAMPAFRTLSNAVVLLQNSVVLGILALGMAVVVIARGIDLSQVAVMAVSAGLSVFLLNSGYGAVTALLISLLVCVVLGAINGWLIAYVEIPALFATLATMLLFFNGARTVVFSNVLQYVPRDASALLYLGQGRVGVVPVSVILLVALAVLVHLFLTRTTVGRSFYAHGDNAEAAALTGLGTRPLTVLEYIVSALLGFVAGLVRTGEAASMDLQIVNGNLIFSVILIVVLGGVSLVGGRGGVVSVVAGTLLVGVTVNAMTLADINNDYQNIVLGVILLGAILLDNKLHPRDEETAKQGD
jgi:ribose transport system permease protein